MTELGLLVQSYNPSAICLQESHLKTCDKDKLTLKNFALYSTYSDDMERATGGSSIFINTNLIHSPVALDTELQAVAVRVSFAKTVTLCSIYVPPKSILSVHKLHNLIEQLPAPFILLGDFNAHNPLWGSDSLSNKGKVLEEFMSQEDLCFFNDGSATYLHPGNGAYSAIDLTVTDGALLQDFSWKVHDDLCGSDHFPIILEHLSSNSLERMPRWKFDRADWHSFETICEDELDPQVVLAADDPIETFTNIILSAADRTIPKTSTNPKSKSKPWYDNDCKNAIKDRKKAERHFNKHPLPGNLSQVRITRAKTRRTLKTKRRKCWRDFVSGITSKTPMRKVWNMIQRLKGKNNKPKVQHLKEGNGLLTSPSDIANRLADNFTEKSSSANYSPQFQRIKARKERSKPNFASKNLEDYNTSF